jgi:hypothetical protein
MSHKTACIFACALLGAGIARGSEFAGTWEGSQNGLPAVELVVRDGDNAINGSIGFYFQTRGADGKWQLGEKYSVPLLQPKIAGRVLTFETIHHKKHGSEEPGPNNRYRVEVVGENEARLQIMRDQTEDGGSGLKLTRRK